VDNAAAPALRQHAAAMAADVIVSYDGTANDEDALALGHALARAGATVALAYVRHTRESDPRKEQIAQHDAERLLENGALVFDDIEPAQHVLLDRSTPNGLRELAAQEGARIIVFGSEYRTSPGRAEPGTSAQSLLEGGPLAVAIAAAGLRVEGNGTLRTVAVSPPGQDGAATEMAEMLAARLGAEVVTDGTAADLVVVGSQPGGAEGRISLGGAARSALNSLRGSVLVVPGGAAPRL
jgi:nucleotide-binding universal stress UspA family protein